MKKENITKKELKVENPCSTYNIVDKDGGTVAQIWDGAGREKDAKELAILFSKSPQLLDTCLKLCSHNPSFWRENMGLLHALIKETKEHIAGDFTR